MADALCFPSSSSSSSSSSYTLKNTTNLQLITSIILHDLSLLCSVITSHPLYFSYFIFFFRYFIKLISFISPLFIATVFLSLLLNTTTTAFCPNSPQLELVILNTLIQELKSNLSDIPRYEIEDFDIYKIVFDGTLSITVCDVEMPLTKKLLEHSVNVGSSSDLDELGFEKITGNPVYGGRRNDDTVSDSDTDKFGTQKLLESSVNVVELGFEKITGNVVHRGNKNDDTFSGSDTDKLGLQKLLESSVDGGQRNDNTVTHSDAVKFGFQKLLESSVHGCRRNDVTVTDSNAVKLGIQKLLECSIQGCRRNDNAASDSDTDKFGIQKLLESSVHGCRRNDDAINASDTDKLGVEKAPETFVHGDRRIEVTVTNSMGNDKHSENSVQNSVRSSSWRSNSLSNVNSGSMGEEKEWRRTLACKLFEERHNSRGGEEGMDSLWEEVMINNNGGIERFEDEDEDEDEEEEMKSGHLCCLQAFKLSTRKMNLGMGRPNILKISKAIKGFGWLHQVKNKHGKRS